MTTFFKLLTGSEWDAFERDGRFEGSDFDRADGFVHLCASDQVAGVAVRHFTGRTDLLVAAVQFPEGDKRLKWERADHGSYPHFYGPLERAWVLSADPIPDDPDARRLALALIAV